MGLITLAGSKTAVWILTVVLSGNVESTRQYEFETKADCEAVIPAIQELYLALGETEVNTICEPGESALPYQSLKANMIWSL